MKKYYVHYTKRFISGLLAGMDVKATISYPEPDMADRAAIGMTRYTPEHPCRAIGGARFHVVSAYVSQEQ